MAKDFKLKMILAVNDFDDEANKEIGALQEMSPSCMTDS